MHGRRHGARRLNFLEYRSPIILTESDAILIERDTDSTNSASESVVAKLPVNRNAVIGIVVGIVAFIIIGVAVYKYRTRRSSKPSSLANKMLVQREYRMDSPDYFSADSEKPEKIQSRPSDGHVGWVPQIKPYSAAPIPAPQPAATVRSKTKGAQFAIVSLTEDGMQLARTPPPVYVPPALSSPKQMNWSRDVFPVPTSPSMEFEPIPLPTPPPANYRASSLKPQKNQTSLSAAVTSRITGPTKTAAMKDRVPRLMNVATTFAPTLADELLIKIGETVRLVEEYNDGWCLVQHVGKMDAPKGVVPHFCLEERQSVIPILTSNNHIRRKDSVGSVKSHWSLS